MVESSLPWQIFLHVATPVITGALTIVGVLIAAKYADKRRRDDQADEDRRRAQERAIEEHLRKDEQNAANSRRKTDQYAAERNRRQDQRAADQRRQEDLDERELERRRRVVEASSERQRRAVGDFLIAVGTTNLDKDSRLNEALSSQIFSPADPTMVRSVKKNTHYRGVYEQQYQELQRAWQLLDLEVTHPEIRKIVELIGDIIREFTLSYGRYAGECAEHAREVERYMNNCAVEEKIPDMRMDFPGPSTHPKLNSYFVSFLHQLRNATRLQLTSSA